VAELSFTATRLNLEDPMVFQVTESGAKPLTFMEGMFIDTEVSRAL